MTGWSLKANIDELIRVFFPSLNCGSYLPKLLNFGTFDPNDASSQTLVDKQAELAVKVNSIVMLVLGGKKKQKKDKDEV